MKIIYHCYGGSHSSVTAAAIHLGLLPQEKLPDRQMLEAVPNFDLQVNKDHGSIRHMGVDEYGNDVFIVGRRNAYATFEQVACSFGKIFDFDDQVYLINCMPYINWKMVVGGFTSRRLGLTGIGRPIVITGIRWSYFRLVSVVHNVKVQVASNNQDLIWQETILKHVRVQ